MTTKKYVEVKAPRGYALVDINRLFDNTEEVIRVAVNEALNSGSYRLPLSVYDIQDITRRVLRGLPDNVFITEFTFMGEVKEI